MAQGRGDQPDPDWMSMLNAVHRSYRDPASHDPGSLESLCGHLDAHPEDIDAFLERFLSHPTWSLADKVHLSAKLLGERSTTTHLRLTASVLDQCLHEPGYFNTLFYYILRVAFVEGAQIEGHDPEAFKRNELWPRYRRFMDTHFREIPFKPASAAVPGRERRIVLITPQILSPRHAPTGIALEYGRTLAIKSNKAVLVADTELFPQTQEAPVDGAFIANRLPDQPDPISNLKYQGAQLVLWRPSKLNFTPAKVIEAVLTVDAYDPSVILSFGDWEWVGDLLARRYPVVHVPYAAGSAMSLAHLYLQTRDAKGEPPLLEGQGGAYQTVGFIPWLAPRKTETVTRADLKLPEDAFCYAVVGNRLATEIDRPFGLAVEAVLTANERACVVVIGANYNGEIEAHLPDRLHQRVISLPFQDDLASTYELLDAYLNPFRMGGGISAFLAVGAGLPIISLRDCDVASAAHLGPGLACVGHEAYIAHAVRVLEDEPYRREFCDATRSRAQETPLLFDAPEQLESICQQAIERFAESQR